MYIYIHICMHVYMLYLYIYIHMLFINVYFIYICVCIYMCNFSAPLSNTVRRLRIPSARPVWKNPDADLGGERFETIQRAWNRFKHPDSSSSENHRSLCISNTWNWKVIMFFWHYPLLFSWCQLNQVCYMGMLDHVPCNITWQTWQWAIHHLVSWSSHWNNFKTCN